MLETLMVWLMGFPPAGRDHYRGQLVCSLALILGVVSVRYSRKVHWSLALLGVGIVTSALHSCFSVESPYAQYGSFMITAFDSVVAKALVEILLIAFLLYDFECAHVYWIGFLGLGCVEAVRLFFGHDPMSISIWDNQAMGASWLAAFLPLAAAQSKWPHPKLSWPVILFVPAILWSGSSVAFATLFVGLAAPAILKLQIRRVLQLVVVAIGSGFMFLHSELLNDNGRRELWREVWEFWQANVSPWFGSGTGSFELYGPHINVSNGNNHTLFIWTHNDWLQILFEQGVLGLVLALTCLGFCLYRTRSRPHLFSAVLCFAFIMVAQMPWRYLPSALYGAVLLRAILGRVGGAFGDEQVAACGILDRGNLVAGEHTYENGDAKRQVHARAVS